MFKNRILLFHLLTALVVTIWGTTFVSTKVLLQHGLNPIEIMFYRFVLAYVCILLVSHKRIWADNWKDETMLMLAGLTGGTFYFIAENTALEITQASNVALLVCTTPIFTSLFMHWLYKEPLRSNVMIGSLIALVAVSAPGLYPIKALYIASDLMMGRRIKFILRIIALMFALAIIWVIVMLPLILFDLGMKNFEWTQGIPFVPICFAVILCFTGIYVTVYLYKYYRYLLNA
mgnify:CR=1 FL=1